MPLINCPDCGKEISDSAKVCLNCGRAFAVSPGLLASLIQLIVGIALLAVAAFIFYAIFS